MQKIEVKTLIMDKIIKIKKYGNRRFYSSEDKSYITLNEIEIWIQKGYSVHVTDAESDENITAEILLQILVQQGRAHHLPTSALETMIRLNDKALIKIWAPLIESNFNLMFRMNEVVLNKMSNFVNPFKNKSSNSRKNQT